MCYSLKFAFVAIVCCSAIPASANSFDPRLFVPLVKQMTRGMESPPRRSPPPRQYRPAQMAQNRCGVAYIPNARGGTILTDLPDCGPYPPAQTRRGWVPPQGGYVGGGYSGSAGGQQQGFQNGFRQQGYQNRGQRTEMKTWHTQTTIRTHTQIHWHIRCTGEGTPQMECHEMQ